MKNQQPIFLFITILGAILFQAVFTNFNLGINTLLWFGFIVFALFYQNKGKIGSTQKVLLAGLSMATIGVITGHTDYSFVVYWLCAFMLISNIAYQTLTKMHFVPLAFLNAIAGIPASFKTVVSKPQNKGKVNYGNILKFIILPIVIIMVLLTIYSSANAMFDKSISRLIEWFSNIFQYISALRIFFFLLGFLMCLFIWVEPSKTLLNTDGAVDFKLTRIKLRKKVAGTLNRLLLRKKQVAIGLFVVLNLMLAWLNILDIEFIWFGFKWDGELLKPMVHEGTIQLLFALLISIGITLFYLNSNIVFFKNNQVFNFLMLLWLFQNMFMVFSVAMRNYYYIEYFALAHKRIYVFYFLICCLIGLISIVIKIKKKKSIAYLLHVNAIAVYLVFVSATLFNWDGVIARNNFANYQQSYVHYPFLVSLNNASLPYLPTDSTILATIKEAQSQKFPDESRRQKIVNFSESVKYKQDLFLETWPNSSWLEWNLPEHKAYILLTEK